MLPVTTQAPPTTQSPQLHPPFEAGNLINNIPKPAAANVRPTLSASFQHNNTRRSFQWYPKMVSKKDSRYMKLQGYGFVHFLEFITLCLGEFMQIKQRVVPRYKQFCTPLWRACKKCSNKVDRADSDSLCNSITSTGLFSVLQYLINRRLELLRLR